MSRGLLIIDIQRDYFPGGAYPLVAPEAAAGKAAELLALFRASGELVIHLQHVWDAPDAQFMIPGTDGVEIHPLVAPRTGETVLQKAEPNGFQGTELAGALAGVDDLVVAGMMSSMCVDATTRAALDRGLAVTVVHDACAAPDLEFAGETIPGRTVHGAFMAALGDAGAAVRSTAELLT
ncbi:nicotinamidase-related amidase [Jatrophihabitans sp. GAS493]|uniref:cysteine hydrolase family protein n=1 Tax=Jatrophihabitans sp. GAS493 TaxID=1907575 RepID=UPI000BBF5613|nr:cysteine hydrolase family protein [Jatrophihabitans sp. GAS493]SOD73270.1 nicotinamidase-related amidase [Jatrophihabitans sp. GAS493]